MMIRQISQRSLILLSCMLFALLSCVSDDDFEVPSLAASAPEIDGDVIDILTLKKSYDQAVRKQMNALGISNTDASAIAQLRRNYSLDLSKTNQYLEGYVVSSDKAGNWFEELIIQDSPSNPTAGIRVLIDESPLFTSYEVGRKIYVRLGNSAVNGTAVGGLHVGDSNGVLSLGFTDNLDKIPAPAQHSFIQRSQVVEEIVPLVKKISEINEDLENLLVTLVDVQFSKEDVVRASLTFAGEPLDEFNGERTLYGCEGKRETILSTSTFASFKSTLLPSGRGSITGVLSRNFFGDAFNIVVNDHDTVRFEDIERCDPVVLDCGLAAAVGINTLFQDSFETQVLDTPITGNGWTNFSQEGSSTWEAYASEGQNASLGTSSRVGSFLSGDQATIAWLVTPRIDFTTQNGETLAFKTSHSFYDSSKLEVLFSSDWDGDRHKITTSNWEVLSAARIADGDDLFADWIDAGLVDLSCLNVKGHIAFRYTGSSDADFDGTFELDDIRIKSE